MRWCVMLVAVLWSGLLSAAEPFRMQNLMLLQPDSVMRERAEHIEALAAYVKALNAAASRELARVGTPRPAAGFVAVAVRPGGRSRIWLDLAPALPDANGDCADHGTGASATIPGQGRRGGVRAQRHPVGRAADRAPRASTSRPGSEPPRANGRRWRSATWVERVWPARAAH